MVGRGERALLWPELLRKEKVGGRKKELGGIPGRGSHTEENKQACGAVCRPGEEGGG